MSLVVRWGTWEELVLGGAVLRHGTDAWDDVADELRARTTSPNHFFTPQEAKGIMVIGVKFVESPALRFRINECQAKYGEIQEQYSGCDAWFEELRKQRVAELKRELEKSEDSIGSLESKLESLTSVRETGSNFGYNTSQTESTSPVEDAYGFDSSSRGGSRDGSSAGSFTERTGKSCTHKCQNLTLVLPQENNVKMQKLEDSLKQKFGCGCLGPSFGIFKKKRGKRKRKGCKTVKEGCVEDSDMLSTAALINREGSADDCNHEAKLSSEENDGTWMSEDDAHLDLAGIMDSIMKHKDVSIFRSRLENQKRARYKKMIRRHVDFRNISWRIGNGSISSANELFRELLLLCNNALVFYPKSSLEHKSALILRALVNKMLRRGFISQLPILSCSDDEVAVPESGGKPKKFITVLQQSTAKNAVVAGKGDETSFKENSVVAGKADGTLINDNALVAGKRDGTSLKKNASVAGKAGGTKVKVNAAVASKVIAIAKGAGAPLKESATFVCKGFGTPVKEKGTVANKRDGIPLKERGNKGSRANRAVESPGRKRGIGRPVKGGQRGGQIRQESPNKGRKRARR